MYGFVRKADVTTKATGKANTKFINVKNASNHKKDINETKEIKIK